MTQTKHCDNLETKLTMSAMAKSGTSTTDVKKAKSKAKPKPRKEKVAKKVATITANDFEDPDNVSMQ